MQLDLARAGKNCCLHIGVLAIDRCSASVYLGLRDEGHAKKPPRYMRGRQRRCEPRTALFSKERFELAWWSRQKNDDARLALDCGLDELTDGAPVAIGKNHATLENICLLMIVCGHIDATIGEAHFERGQERFIPAKRDVKSGRDRLAGEVVLCRTKTSGEEDNVGTRERDTGGTGEVLE